MNSKAKNRLKNLILISIVLTGFTGLFLKSFKESVSYYKTPAEFANSDIKSVFRLGGYVKEKSLRYGDNGLIKFIVTDFNKDMKVEYKGLLPDLFREGQGVVLEGEYKDGVFYASKIFAKHDENYKPPQEKK